MKIIALACISLMVVAAAAPAFAALGDVVNYYPAPAANPYALARTNTALYVFCLTSPYRVYRLVPSSGSVLSSFVSPSGVNTRGLSYQWGGNLWLGNGNNDYVYRCIEWSGSILASWPADHDVVGLACQGNQSQPGTPTAIFVNDNYPAYVWRHNLSGSRLSQFGLSSDVRAFDAAWDYRNNLLWLGSYWTEYIYGVTSTGSRVASFRAPAGTENPRGMAYYDGLLFVATTSGTPDDYIWAIDCPPNVAVEPASIGKLKALFR